MARVDLLCVFAWGFLYWLMSLPTKRFGPMLIGALLNMSLYGVSLIFLRRASEIAEQWTGPSVESLPQIPSALGRYRKDNSGNPDFPWIRRLIIYLCVAGTAAIFVQCGTIYQPLIMQYGALCHTSNPIVSAPIQLFTAWRIRCIMKHHNSNFNTKTAIIRGSFIIPTLIAILSLIAFGLPVLGSGMTLAFLVILRNRQFSDFPRVATLATVWLGTAAACDVGIAIAMTWTLLTRPKQFDSPDLKGRVSRIVRLTLMTGSLTALGSLADVCIFHMFPNTTLNFVVNFPLSSLYICSVLSLLNLRERPASQEVETGSVSETTATEVPSLGVIDIS
ncbi:hypothetical protein FB45DRAFT_999701 [Roridomyces roridus]|uniref:DUF6534 domain-containing protein n=1 Tax=Roridomyces roridus TaxID=1738132 RepID=A0AAD7FYM3_9AGAR|nr:hypothetical protein FB45DRAFT_999701 [Roridomyces roridus]